MIGTTIGQYRVTRLLGRGGKGEVYLADDTRLQRPVALKFLRDGPGTGGASDDLLAEARAAARLNHPSICTVYEVGEHAGRPYLAMEYVDGGTLADVIAGGPLPPRRAVTIAIRLAEAVAAAHAAGFCHRDLKPANVMLTAGGEVRITDFGLSRPFAEDRTMTAGLVGTPAYMAPEQVEERPPDARTDVWALGVILYEMLTGTLPFPGRTLSEVLHAILQAEPPPLAGRCATCPTELADLVARTLARDPGARPADAGALAGALRALPDLPDPAHGDATATVTAPTATPPAGARAPVGSPSTGRARRWRPGWLILLLILLGAAVTPFLLRDGEGPADAPAGPPRLAVLDFHDLAGHDQPLLASREISGLLESGLVRTRVADVLSRPYLREIRSRLFAQRTGAIAAEEALAVAGKAGARFVLTGSITERDGRPLALWSLIDAGSGVTVAADSAGGADLFAIADRVVGRVAAAIDPTRDDDPDGPAVTAAPTPSRQAYRYYVAGLIAREELRIGEARSALETAVTLDPEFALAMLELSRTLYGGQQRFDHAEAVAWADSAWALRDRLNERERLRLEAQRLKLDYRVGEAIAVSRKLLARMPQDLDTLKDLHGLLFEFWYGGEALDIARRGLEFYPDDSYFGLYYQIGLEFAGRHREAMTATRRYLSLFPDKPNAWDELGWRFLASGRPDSARWAFGEALARDPGFFHAHQGRMYAAYAAGHLDSAVAIGEALLARRGLRDGQRVAVLTDNHVWPGLSLAHACAGRHSEALAQFDRARALLADDAISELRLEAARARLWRHLGRSDDVLAWAEGLAARSVGRLGELYRLQFTAPALVAVGRFDAARAAMIELEAAESAWGNIARGVALNARIGLAMAERRYDDALETTLALEDLPMPPGGLPFIAHHEVKARALSALGRHTEALIVLARLQRVCRGYHPAEALRGDILAASGDANGAREAYETFLAAWSGAEPDAALLQHVRTRLARLDGPDGATRRR